MDRTHNSNKPIFQYRDLEASKTAKDTDIFMQKKNSINGKKMIVFERVPNGNLLDKVGNFLKGFRRASPDKIQAFFESRGLDRQSAYKAAKNILDKHRSASQLEIQTLVHRVPLQVELPD